MYQVNNGKEYRTVESFVQQEIEKKSVNISSIREEIKQLEELIGDEEKFFDWLDMLTEKESIEVIQGDDNP